jgi:hypothetical protein
MAVMSESEKEIRDRLRAKHERTGEHCVTEKQPLHEGMLLPVDDYALVVALKKPEAYSVDEDEVDSTIFARGMSPLEAAQMLHEVADSFLKQAIDESVGEHLQFILRTIPREKVFEVLGKAGIPYDDVVSLYEKHG